MFRISSRSDFHRMQRCTETSSISSSFSHEQVLLISAKVLFLEQSMAHIALGFPSRAKLESSYVKKNSIVSSFSLRSQMSTESTNKHGAMELRGRSVSVFREFEIVDFNSNLSFIVKTLGCSSPGKS